MKKFKHYSKAEKREMVKLYEAFKNYAKAADKFGCAMSTVYYTVNPEKYEEHREYVKNKSSR